MTAESHDQRLHSETSRTLRRLAIALLAIVAAAALAFLIPYTLHFRATRLHRACARGDLAAVQRLIASGADLDRPCSTSFLVPIYIFTPLQHAMLNDHEPVMAALLASGADIEARNNWSMTPLLLAVWEDRPQSVRWLLKAGANPNVHNPAGSTPLEVAANRGDFDLVQTLLAHSADPDFAPPNAESLREWATRTRNAEVLAILREPK